jgi:hypothetical protein
MNQSEKTFEQIFHKELESTLLSLNYSRLQLPNGWIQPTFLFKHNTTNVWLGCSWDWRDNYFEADLGTLFLFKDVLPRVIVLGFNLVGTTKYESIDEYLTKQMMIAREKILYLTRESFNTYSISIEDIKKKRINNIINYVDREVRDLSELPFINSL